MTHSAWKTTLLAALLTAPSSALLVAQPAPTPPQPPPVVAPPEAPAPPAPPRARRKKVVVESPDRDIVVDGDRILIDGGDFDAEDFADLDAFRWKAPGHGSGFIGVQAVEMTPDLRQHFGAPKDAGVFVGTVEKDGPAARAGLQVGDIVTKVDGDSIASRRELARAVRHKRKGETITVEVLRNRAAKSLTVTVAERRGDDVRVGEFEVPGHGPGFDWSWDWATPRPGHPKVAPPPSPDYPELEQRIQDLEKKLKDLEGRLPNR